MSVIRQGGRNAVFLPTGDYDVIFHGNSKSGRDSSGIEQEVKPVPEEVAKLKEMADANVAMIMTFDIESLENRKEILQSIEAFGMNKMRSFSMPLPLSVL